MENDNLRLTDEAVRILEKPTKKQLPDPPILDWNYLNRKINEEWHKQKADMAGVTFIEFKTTCMAHIRQQLYSGTPLDEIMIGKNLNEIEKDFADMLIGKIEKKVIKDIKQASTFLKITNYTQNVQRFFAIQPFCYDQSKIFWFWNKEEFKWEIVDETDLMNAIDDALAFGGETVTANVKQNYIEAFKRIGRKNKPKDMPITWIQFKENIYDYKNDEMINATPEYFCCNPIPHDLGDSEETPIMDKIFEEWVGNDYIKLLYEIIAYCMLQDYPLARIFAFIGSGSNGKTCYLTLLKKTIGEENCSATSMDRIIKTFGTTSFYKKLACLLGETNYNQLEKTEMLKRLSGGDLIDYEFKGKNIFSSKNYAKILIATNTLPITLDKTDGFYRRWCCVYFSNKFSEKIDILNNIPKEEYNNLCKKCLNLIKEINERRCFTNEGSLEERKQKYEKYSNPLKLFIEEKCVIDINVDLPAFEFYDSFLSYLRERGYREMNKHEVGNLMNDLGYEKKLKWVKINKIINGKDIEDDKQWLHYLGLRFKQKYEIQNKLDVIDVNDVKGGVKLAPSDINQYVSSITSLTSFPKSNFPCAFPVGEDISCGKIETYLVDGLYYCEEHLKKYLNIGG